MFEPSKASTAQFDVREDEEQYAKMMEILDLLISAGYFRAKIQGLSAFDKVKLWSTVTQKILLIFRLSAEWCGAFHCALNP